MKTKQNRFTDIENQLMVKKGYWDEKWKNWQFGINRCKLLYRELINNKVLTIDLRQLYSVPGDKP